MKHEYANSNEKNDNNISMINVIASSIFETSWKMLKVKIHEKLER